MKLYIITFGIILTIMGIFEIINPVKTFKLWQNWISKKIFFLHGLILIIAGFPLTIYKGSFSGIIFIIGLFFVLTGPVILIYPEKIKNMFNTISQELDNDGLKKIIFSDAAIRIAIGILFILSYIFN